MSCLESYEITIDGKEYQILEPNLYRERHFIDFDGLKWNIEILTRRDLVTPIESAEYPEDLRQLTLYYLQKLKVENEYEIPKELIPVLKNNHKHGNYWREKIYMVEKEVYEKHKEEGSLKEFKENLEDCYSYYLFQVNLEKKKNQL